MLKLATTVAAYLAALPEERRAVVEAVRKVILANIDADLEEGMQYGMISYYVPHRIYPPGYHCDPRQPLTYLSLAAQKNHFALYFMTLYGDADLLAWFEAEWAKSGKKLDMGKSCVRFKKLEDLALPVIGEVIARVPTAKYIARYEQVLARTASTSRSAKKTAPPRKKATRKKAVTKKVTKKKTPSKRTKR